MPPSTTRLTDLLGRPVENLRVSLTDRCNLRCTYCMPRDAFGIDHAFLPRAELLTFEEITRLVRVFARLGVTKLRLTGGEPLLRRDLPDLVAMLTALEGIDDLALTTNGLLLTRHADALAAAGLRRVTVSLDALDDETFRAVTDTAQPVAAVLDGIDAALVAGFDPVKVNTVLQRGVNDHQIEALAGWARETGVVLRFIEFMDVGTTNRWMRERVVPASEVAARIDARWPIEPVGPDEPVTPLGGNGVASTNGNGSAHLVATGRMGAVAERYRYLDGAGEVGIIASVTRPFCRTCTRARLSAVGELFTCLFAATGHDLRAPLRDGVTDAELADAVARIWSARDDRSSELRTAGGLTGPRVEMSYIGG